MLIKTLVVGQFREKSVHVGVHAHAGDEFVGGVRITQHFEHLGGAAGEVVARREEPALEHRGPAVLRPRGELVRRQRPGRLHGGGFDDCGFDRCRFG